MTLDQALAILAAHAHCGADVEWIAAFNGVERHALGMLPKPLPPVLLSAADAVRIAQGYHEAAECPQPSS